jgi:hypothetical protein
MKALVIMIVKRLHKVGELLAVLEEDTPEMQEVRRLLSEGGRFPSKRTFPFQAHLPEAPEGFAQLAARTDRLSGTPPGGSAQALGE